MNEVMARIIFAGAFALLALGGGIFLEASNKGAGGAPEWLIAIAALAAGYAFGHVTANGKHPGGR
jgi:hypothetical protein